MDTLACEGLVPPLEVAEGVRTVADDGGEVGVAAVAAGSDAGTGADGVVAEALGFATAAVGVR